MFLAPLICYFYYDEFIALYKRSEALRDDINQRNA